MIISIRRPYIWNALLKYSVRPSIVRAICSGLSLGIFALATFDSASSMPFAKPPMRTETRMVSSVTPAEVAPPLPPEKVMQGGEYGSLGICSGRSAHPLTEVGPPLPPPGPPAEPLPPPPAAAAAIAASASAAALAAASSFIAAISSSLRTSDSKASSPSAAPVPSAISESSIDATETSFCWLGTNTAMARNTAANPTRGP